MSSLEFNAMQRLTALEKEHRRAEFPSLGTAVGDFGLIDSLITGVMATAVARGKIAPTEVPGCDEGSLREIARIRQLSQPSAEETEFLTYAERLLEIHYILQEGALADTADSKGVAEGHKGQGRFRKDEVASFMVACHTVSTLFLYLLCIMMTAYFPGPVLRGVWGPDESMAFAIFAISVGIYFGVVAAVWLLTAPWAKRRNWLASLPVLAFALRVGFLNV